MEINLNLHVTLELPAWAEALAEKIASNVAIAPVAASAAETQKEQPAQPATLAKPAAPAPKPKATVGKPAPKLVAQAQKPAAPAAPAKQAATEQPEAEEGEHTLDELMKMLRDKFEGNQSTIKAKLTELGAASLSKLDPEHYDEMFDFLSQL